MPELAISSAGTVVCLRVSRSQAEDAAARMGLAAPLSRVDGNPSSLWLGPDQWWLMSDALLPGQLIELCQEKLSGLTFNATDNSDAITTVRLAGPDVHELLASGSGLDFSLTKFPVGGCQRTKFAQILVTIVRTAEDVFDLMFDSAFRDYLESWIAAAAATTGENKAALRH